MTTSISTTNADQPSLKYLGAQLPDPAKLDRALAVATTNRDVAKTTYDDTVRRHNSWGGAAQLAVPLAAYLGAAVVSSTAIAHLGRAAGPVAAWLGLALGFGPIGALSAMGGAALMNHINPNKVDEAKQSFGTAEAAFVTATQDVRDAPLVTKDLLRIDTQIDTFVRGYDHNHDGKVNLKWQDDIGSNEMLRSASGGPAIGNGPKVLLDRDGAKIYDVDGDGAVTGAEAAKVYLVNHRPSTTMSSFNPLEHRA